MARPTVRTPEVDRKIEECAYLGASIEEIAFFAGIHRDTLYDWMKKDTELSDRIKELQERPILLARQTVIKAIDNPEYATWYLERKRKKEFSARQELTGEDGSPLQVNVISYKDADNNSAQLPTA
jgi:hypothetical protein